MNNLTKLFEQKELFIFDLDGTLFNTLGDLAPAVNYALGQIGLKELSQEKIKECIGSGSMNLIKRSIAGSITLTQKGTTINLRDFQQVDSLLNDFGFTLDKVTQVHKIYSEYYWEHCTENTQPYEGVIEFLNIIKSKNTPLCNGETPHKYAALLTNKPYPPTKKILDKFNLTPLFKAILCGDTAPKRKPDPAGIEAILKQLKITPEKVLMIGDDTPDILAAKNAGVESLACLKGFGTPENLLPLNPNYTLNHIQDFFKT